MNLLNNKHSLFRKVSPELKEWRSDFEKTMNILAAARLLDSAEYPNIDRSIYNCVTGEIIKIPKEEK